MHKKTWEGKNKISMNLQMMIMYMANPEEYTDKLLELTSHLVELLDTKSVYKNQFISVENVILKYDLYQETKNKILRNKS